MKRIICHWTGGTHRANATDRAAYHLLIEGGGRRVWGDPPIVANTAPLAPNYARHTANLNTGSIGVAVCCMAGAMMKSREPGEIAWREMRFWAVALAVLIVLALVI